MAVRATNTFPEELSKLLSDIARMKTLPDADLDFILDLETMVLQKIREPQDMLAQMQANKGGMPAPGSPEMAMAGAPPGGEMMPPGGGGMPPEMMGAPPGGPGGGMPPELAGLPPELLMALMGGAAGAGEGGAAAGGPLPMPPVNGTRVQPAMPNPDELRRMVGQ